MQIHSGSFKSTAVTAFAAFAIGAVAWSGHLFTLLGLLALPIVFKCAKGTPQRITTLACYYAGSIWPIMPGAAQFFGNEALLHPLSIVILWITSTAVLTLPWIWLFAAPRCKSEWALPIGLSDHRSLADWSRQSAHRRRCALSRIGMGWTGCHHHPFRYARTVPVVLRCADGDASRRYATSLIRECPSYRQHGKAATPNLEVPNYPNKRQWRSIRPSFTFKRPHSIQMPKSKSFPKESSITGHRPPRVSGNRPIPNCNRTISRYSSGRKSTDLTAVNIATNFSCVASTQQHSNNESRSHTPCGDRGTTSAFPSTTSAQPRLQSVLGTWRPSSAMSNC
jgi:hypothetical protein